MMVSVGKVQGYANKFMKPKHRNLAKTNGGEHGHEQKHAHIPDGGCNDWMLCKGILAVTNVNFFSQTLKMFRNQHNIDYTPGSELRLIQISK